MSGVRLVVTARLDDGREHVLAIDGVGDGWKKAFDQKRREEPDGFLTFGAALDGGHRRMWALRAGNITGLAVEYAA